MVSISANEVKLKFREDVKIARHGADVVVLVGGLSTKPLRLTGISSCLTDLLATGCTRRDLCDHLQNLGFAAQEVETAIETFLRRLSSAQFLQTDTDLPRKRRASWMMDIDPVAKFLARPFSWFPLWVITVFGCMVFATMLLLVGKALMNHSLLPTPADFSFRSLWALAGFIPRIFLHELAHAVACRSVGCEVSGLGFQHVKGWKFSFFVDTRYLPLVQSRWAKAWVSLAGPFMDLILLGCFGLLTLRLSFDSGLLAPIHMFCFFLTLAFWLNLSPLRISDGSNAISILLDDPYLRVNSLSFKSDRKCNWIHYCYRAATSLHFFVLIAIIGYFLQAWWGNSHNRH